LDFVSLFVKPFQSLNTNMRSRREGKMENMYEEEDDKRRNKAKWRRNMEE
jgi:hypothetical protein